MYLRRYNSHIFLAALSNHYWYIIEIIPSVYGKDFYRLILFHLFVYENIFVELKCLNSLYWDVFTDEIYVNDTAGALGLVLLFCFFFKVGSARLVKPWFLRSLLLLVVLIASPLLISLTTFLLRLIKTKTTKNICFKRNFQNRTLS